MQYKYIICSGWWCSEENRDFVFGDDVIRGKDFHNLWYASISKFTNPNKIFICDSNSPVKPEYDKSIEFLSLNINAGHATNIHPSAKYCGWTSSVLMGLSFCELNDCDYFVYVEQDVLLFGSDIIENSIRFMEEQKLDYLFGNPKGSAQPIEVSFFIVKKARISKLKGRYQNINFGDDVISPEMKLALSTSCLYYFPKSLIRNKYVRILLTKILRKRKFHPFGYGRSKPINFEDANFYFQHGTTEEIELFKAKVGLDDK
ncbi:TPA: hypothetical protein KD093_001034 [Vibrio parahaemolyticus]|nr:hypothetical protein [Vibrio parahaemolyticus]